MNENNILDKNRGIRIGLVSMAEEQVIDIAPIIEKTGGREQRAEERQNVLEKPHISAYLTERGDKLETDRDSILDINDVAFFFNARGRDIANELVDKTSKNKFKDMAEAIENARAGIKKMTAGEKEDIIDYLTSFYKNLDRQAPTSGEMSPELARNLQIFESLILAVKDQPLVDEHHEKAEEVIPEPNSDQSAETHEASLSLKDKVLLPEYKHTPGDKVNTFFAKERNEGDVSLETVNEFVVDARDDLVTQNERFERENAEVIGAVDKANEFLRYWIDTFDTDERGTIAVVVRDGQVVEANWENKLKPTEGKIYKFDSRTFSDSVTLGDYYLRRMQYLQRIEGPNGQAGANKAVQLLEKLQANPRLKMTNKELLPIFQVIDRHAQYIKATYEELLNRFDGIDGDRQTAIEAARKDPALKDKVEPLESQARLLNLLAGELKMREKPESGRIASGIRKLGKRMFYRNRSKE